MTPEAQRIAIAKACGLTIVSDGITRHLTPCGKKTEREPEGCLLKECPDYLNDKHTIHAAVAELPEYLQPVYMNKLFYELIAIKKDAGVSDFDKHLAEADVCCRAFLKTLNLWQP